MKIYEVVDPLDDQDSLDDRKASVISPEAINRTAQSLSNLTSNFKEFLEGNPATSENSGKWADELADKLQTKHDVYSIIELCRVLDGRFENLDTSKAEYSSDVTVTSKDIDRTYDVLNDLVMDPDALDSMTKTGNDMTELAAQIKKFVDATKPIVI